MVWGAITSEGKSRLTLMENGVKIDKKMRVWSSLVKIWRKPGRRSTTNTCAPWLDGFRHRLKACVAAKGRIFEI
ncbi:hypothetical protein Aduo_019046 [Ancylostoma duodenale]